MPKRYGRDFRRAICERLVAGERVTEVSRLGYVPLFRSRFDHGHPLSAPQSTPRITDLHLVGGELFPNGSASWASSSAACHRWSALCSVQKGLPANPVWQAGAPFTGKRARPAKTSHTVSTMPRLRSLLPSME